MNAVHEHVFSRIEASGRETDPFPHLYVRNVFPEDFYSELLDNLPPDDRYQAYDPPYQSRLSINLNRNVASGLGPFWEEFEAWINGQAFLDRMASIFADVLPTMQHYRKELVAKSSEGDVVKIGCRTLINRDYSNFALGPHTDSPAKFITGIFYLPRDDRFAAFGTSIYEPKQAGFTAWRSPHFPHEEFRLLKTYPNVPNSLFVFAKTDISFHGVEPGDYPNDGRNMLMWFPEIGQSARTATTSLQLARKLLTGVAVET